MSIHTELTQRFKLTHPIIQAPLAGGGDTPELVASVCNAGALGFIGAAYLTPEQIQNTAAAVALGAAAVQMGTAFLTCHEAGIPEAYKQAILNAHEDQTRVTRAFSGRPARGIVNRFMREIDCSDGQELILPFPVQNSLTRPLRTAAAKQGRAEFLSLWSGQGVRLARRQSASELISRLAREMEATMAELHSYVAAD